MEMALVGEMFTAVALLEDVIEVAGTADERGQALAFVFECALAVGYGLVEFAPARRDDAEVHAGLGGAHRGLDVPSGRACFAMTSAACYELRRTNAQIEFLLRRALADAGRLPGRAGPMRPRGRPPAASWGRTAGWRRCR